MAVNTSLAGLSQTPGSNGPDGNSDAPSTLDDAIRYALSFIAQLRDGGHQWLTSVAGTNTITGSANGITSLVAGQTFRFAPAATSSGAVTLNINTLGAKNVMKPSPTGLIALSAADLIVGCTTTVAYDGAQFVLQNIGQVGLRASNGYMRHASGFIEQWGTVASAGTSPGNATVTFPIAFPNACLNVIANPQSTGSAADIGIQVGTSSTSGATLTTVQNATIVSGIGLFWRAIGY